jgi:phosphoribosyl 1,2-cyclic phosphodiesterase
MKIVQIASGSKGNSTYIESGDTRIIIDCGISKKRIVDVLRQYNYNLDSIDAILITHEHTDHVSGLLPLYRATNAIIYMTLGTFDG